MDLDKYADKLKSKVNDRNFDGSLMPKPVDKTQWPLEISKTYLEIGCGAGLHPILFSKENPNIRLIAFERTKEKFEKFKRRVETHKFTNIIPIHEDALHWLYPHKEKAFAYFDKIFLLYPNPYPKITQRNKRFLAAPSFQFLLSTLKPEGEIELRSNESFYIQEAIFLAQEVWDLEVIENSLVRDLREALQGVTHFERKYLKENENCRRVIFKRK